ncbi:hypothetical protein CYMTET_31670 [Cymbomonas tetramitiformis]|uniref:Uncharacterized protein n=1 Tax=Cymbomonas tetramitiformis TaxID=36881 RepID=A0AAE0FGM1_9CHLO|nr:hypothetical protein CYMTET_31670 [Cymbomonas tetramitiformis]
MPGKAERLVLLLRDRCNCAGIDLDFQKFMESEKGQWDPVPLIKHLGLKVDLQEGEFCVAPARLKEIHTKATELLCEAPREQLWLPPESWPLSMVVAEGVAGSVQVERAEDLEVACLYCDNQALVAMLLHLTRCNPVPMMRAERAEGNIDSGPLRLRDVSSAAVALHADEWNSSLRDRWHDELCDRWRDELRNRWRDELGESRYTELAAQMRRGRRCVAAVGER